MAEDFSKITFEESRKIVSLVISFLDVDVK
jgi:hypothetical protein